MSQPEMTESEARAKLDALAIEFHFDSREFELSPTGYDNFSFLGPETVVRIAKWTQDRPQTEIVTATKAIELGIRTPRPVEWGEDWSIWERLPGVNAWTFGRLEDIDWNPLLDDLVILHQNPIGPERDVDWEILEVDSYREILSDPSLVEIRSDVERLVTAPKPPGGTFIHGDAHGGNVIVDSNGKYVGLIDWGDADWGPADVEWAHLEEPALAAARQRPEFQMNPEIVAQFKLIRALRLTQAGNWPVKSVVDSYASCVALGL